jgi:1,4-alpha-glucan branching enzyme
MRWRYHAIEHQSGCSPITECTVRPAASRNNSRFSDFDVYLFRQGSHFRLHHRLGAHRVELDGASGVRFALWAPNAERVHVIGDFNGWNRDMHALSPRADQSGIWEGFVPGVDVGALYKYRLTTLAGDALEKADPFARAAEAPPATASRVWRDEFAWRDEDWMRTRKARNALDAPMSIYELHLGSWRRAGDSPPRPLTYRELAEELPEYLARLGFTHVEFMPVMEHPFYGSWGYQCTGFFAPTARYGTPEDFKALVDALHRRGIGVILDWVPSHFPNDPHGLAHFDGTSLFEHADPRQGFHPEWKSHIFNYGRNEVRAFLGSSALFWLEEFHADGLRTDAVASMLYLDYARAPGEWIPNQHGGRENLEAMGFLRQLNEAVYRDHPDTQVFAEESTAWPMVSRPVYLGGLGFGLKWNMGWMHDTLDYFKSDPIHRKFHHDRLTFSIWYAFSENFVLPLSHDEVVYGKGSLIGRMPGDEWQRFANLRLLLGYMWAHPGKKLLFMGGEFGQYREWSHESSLDWHLLEQPLHAGLQAWMSDLNRVYRQQPALHTVDFSGEGFEWLDRTSHEESLLSFLRWDAGRRRPVLVACNFTPVTRRNLRCGVPLPGRWRELVNSDSQHYGGSGQGNLGGLEAAPFPAQGHYHSLQITLPPLACVLFGHEPDAAPGSVP